MIDYGTISINFHKGKLKAELWIELYDKWYSFFRDLTNCGFEAIVKKKNESSLKYVISITLEKSSCRHFNTVLTNLVLSIKVFFQSFKISLHEKKKQQ